MPTRQELERAIREQARRNNWGVVLDRWPHRTTYYTPDGRAMPNLPADPWSMQRYLARGFSLAPPANPTAAPPPSVGVDELVLMTDPAKQEDTASSSNTGGVFCETCGKNFDNKKRPEQAKKAHKRAAGH